METYGWRLHAFVLMTNHEHLFVETPVANLSAGMQYLGGSYTSYFNRRHRRSGHLFQGRFKAHLVEGEGYFREVSRYIHLNPVRAGMATRPRDYPWSSYPGYVRSRRAAAWGYRSHGGVSNAIVRIESAGPAIKRTAEKLARKLH